jgi:hypothetical protein
MTIVTHGEKLSGCQLCDSFFFSFFFFFYFYFCGPLRRWEG